MRRLLRTLFANHWPALALAVGLVVAVAIPYSWLEVGVIAVVHIGLVPAVAYPLLWHLRATWHDSRIGRALMHKAVALAALFVVSVANVWLPGAWWAPVYAVTVTAVTWTLWRQFAVLRSVLREREE